MIKDYKLENGVLYFTSDVPPSTNHYNSWRSIPKRVGSKTVYIPQAYASKEYKAFKKSFEPYLNELLNEIEWDIKPTEVTHYYLDVIMYFDRRDKDSNNYFKCPMDVMNERLYIDDKTIIARCNRVYYTNNPDMPPHFEYKLYPVDYIGIWENEEDYNKFIDKCKTCRNYKEHKCKRLADYETYKITKDFDIETGECLGFKLKK